MEKPYSALKRNNLQLPAAHITVHRDGHRFWVALVKSTWSCSVQPRELGIKSQLMSNLFTAKLMVLSSINYTKTIK